MRFRVSRSRSQAARNLPLARSRCEELANYYLGYNGWSSEILYHRREEGPEIPAGTLCYVTVVRLTFKQVKSSVTLNSRCCINLLCCKHFSMQSGLDCEGAGKCEAPQEDHKANTKLMSELAKKSKGEAMLAAWEKVLLVIVEGRKVSVEINTNKRDTFFYDPTWDEPQVTVNEIDS